MTEAPPFRSGEPSSIASLLGTRLCHLIKDRYGISLCAGVPFPVQF
jgi:hypothetical protein